MSALAMRIGKHNTGLIVEQPLRAESGTGTFRIENGRIENGQRLYDEYRIPLQAEARELRMTLLISCSDSGRAGPDRSGIPEYGRAVQLRAPGSVRKTLGLIEGIHVAEQCDASAGMQEHDVLPFGEESVADVVD